MRIVLGKRGRWWTRQCGDIVGDDDTYWKRQLVEEAPMTMCKGWEAWLED
jgi:hypothetical protein